MDKVEELMALENKLLAAGFKQFSHNSGIDKGNLFMTYEFEDKSALDICIYRFGEVGIELALFEYKGKGKGHVGENKEYDQKSSEEFDMYNELLEYLEIQ